MFNSVRSSRIAIYLGVLVLLLIAVSGMEATADDGRAISTVSTSSVASLQVVRVSLSSETAYAVTCHFKGDAKIGPEKNCFYDCLGRKVWIVISSRKKCPLTIQGDMTIDQLSRTEQVPTAS